MLSIFDMFKIHPVKTVLYCMDRFFHIRMNDKNYIEFIYQRMYDGVMPNLDKPELFNEKLQWLKLHDHKAIYTTMVDKYDVKELVASIIGFEHIIPSYGVWNHFEDINFLDLPEQFVLKCTHDSGGLVIVTDKETFDYKAARNKINKCMRKNYYYSGREWPYKDVKPRILAEKYMKDCGNDDDNVQKMLVVYKFFCFSGKPEIIQVIQNDKTPDETIDYYDSDWNLLDLRQGYPNSKNHLEKPKMLKQMLKYASILSSGFPFIRTDFYSIKEHVFFSEFTFYTDGGFSPFEPNEWDIILGKKVELKHLT